MEGFVNGDFFPIIIALIALLLLLWGFILYIKSLVNAAKSDKWVWFVLMLLIWPIFFLYLLVGYRALPKSKYLDER